MEHDRNGSVFSSSLCPPGYVTLEVSGNTAFVRQDVTPDQLRLLLSTKTEVLKDTVKTQVWAVGHWVVKERKRRMHRALVTPTANRNLHQKAWRASHFLRNRGVRVPEPLAYIEQRRAGIVIASWHIFQYLRHSLDVESFLAQMILNGADGTVLAKFLKRLAEMVVTLEASGAYHGDLSGKNIYTPDGYRFYLIDLDAVEIETAITEDMRLKNHVQLYDSFCDALSDALLVPFIEQMLPETIDLRTWMPNVRHAQQERRRRVEAYWLKHGKPERVNPLRQFKQS